jgi:hypothetical protein
MRATFCDIDGREIKREEDIRHVNITKVDGESDKPVMPEREVCVHCAEKIRKYIVRMEGCGNEEVDNEAPAGV